MRKKTKSRDGVFSYEARGQIRWGFHYRDPLGGPTTLRGFARKTDAMRRKSELMLGAGLASTSPLLQDGIKQHRRFHVEQVGNRASSYRYLAYWTQVLPNIRVDRIRTQQVRLGLETLARGKSNATRNRIINQLSSAFTWFESQGWIVAHPIRGKFRSLPESARNVWLTPRQVSEIAEQCPPWLRSIIRFAAATGLRLNTICSLSAQKVHSDARGRRFLHLPEVETKNDDPLSVPLVGWVDRLVRQQLAGSTRPDDLIFPGPRGGNAHSSIRRFLPAAVRAAGLEWGEQNPEGVTFHTFRHTFATTARSLGVDERTVMEIGGWRDRDTAASYSHGSSDEAIEASRKIADALEISSES